MILLSFKNVDFSSKCESSQLMVMTWDGDEQLARKSLLVQLCKSKDMCEVKLF